MKKVAVVTGAAKGLGKAMSLALSDEGFEIVIHYNKSRNEADNLLLQISKKSPRSIIASCDLRVETEVNAMFKNIEDVFGSVDLLVNNVGNFLYKKFSETTSDEFKDIVETNVFSTLFCSRAALPKMRIAKSGHIINIGAVGVGSTTILEMSTPYYIAKNALYTLTKIMAWEEAKQNIHINMISPASLIADIFDESDFPMGRTAQQSDIIKALRFLISDDAYYINGANIEVAGGFIPGMI